jgi:hypothetical protein
MQRGGSSQQQVVHSARESNKNHALARQQIKSPTTTTTTSAHNVPNLAMSTHSIASISYTLFVLCTSRQQTSLKPAVREQVECIKKAARGRVCIQLHTSPCVEWINFHLRAQRRAARPKKSPAGRAHLRHF